MTPPPLPGAPDPARWFWFDGILDGRRGDDAALRAALAQVHAAGLLRLALTEDGGRFTLLADDTPQPGSRWAPAAADQLLHALAELVAPGGGATRVESTLRLTEVHGAAVRETLFAVRGGQLVPLTRERPVTDADRTRTPEGAAPPPAPPGTRRKALLLGGLLLVAFAGVAWQSGYIGLLLAPRADTLAVDPGPFGDLLRTELGSSLGRYQITLTRGTSFPSDQTQLEALLRRSTALTDRAAVQAVGNGDVVWVRLERADGAVLEATRVELRPLLGAADGRAEALLPGRLGAARVHLALDAGATRR